MEAIYYFKTKTFTAQVLFKGGYRGEETVSNEPFLSDSNGFFLGERFSSLIERPFDSYQPL